MNPGIGIDIFNNPQANLYEALKNAPINSVDLFGLSDDPSWDALKKLLQALRDAAENLPDDPRACMSPCTSAASLRVICDCVWDALKSAKKAKKTLSRTAKDIADCACLGSPDPDYANK